MTRAEKALALLREDLEGRTVLEAACGCGEFSLCAARLARVTLSPPYPRDTIIKLGSDAMAERKAKWQNDYILRTYDRINLTVPKGEKDRIKAHAEIQGESVNGYINRFIQEDMQRAWSDSGALIFCPPLLCAP